MKVGNEWKVFFRRLRSEFAVSDCSVYAGDGCEMERIDGKELPNELLEQYLSYETTMIITEKTGCRMITRFPVFGTVYLLVLFTQDMNGLSENETSYILRDLHTLQERLRHQGKEQAS